MKEIRNQASKKNFTEASEWFIIWVQNWFTNKENKYLYRQKYILSEFKRVGLYKKIYSSPNPLSKVHNGGFMNNENPANTQNSTIHQENKVYRYIKEKKLVTNTYAFENIMHGHLFGTNCIQFFFFCEPCFFDLSTQHIPFLFYLVTNCLSFLVAEGG